MTEVGAVVSADRGTAVASVTDTTAIPGPAVLFVRETERRPGLGPAR